MTSLAADVTPSSYDELIRELSREPDGLTALSAGGVVSKAVLNSTILYRGCADKRWTLSPSLARVPNCAVAEAEILNDLRMYGKPQLDKERLDGEWDLLAIGQHHGMPTRLLDWSFHPDAALHFASEGAAGSTVDGAVWIVAPSLLHFQLPPNLRRDLAGKDLDYPGPFKQPRLDVHLPNLAALDALGTASFTPVVFMEPAWTDPRISAQSGLFSVAADPAADLLDLLQGVPGCFRRIILSPDLKREIRETLDGRGQDERRYFPGLDGVCRFLKRTYS